MGDPKQTGFIHYKYLNLVICVFQTWTFICN